MAFLITNRGYEKPELIKRIGEFVQKVILIDPGHVWSDLPFLGSFEVKIGRKDIMEERKELIETDYIPLQQEPGNVTNVLRNSRIDSMTLFSWKFITVKIMNGTS